MYFILTSSYVSTKQQYKSNDRRMICHNMIKVEKVTSIYIIIYDGISAYSHITDMIDRYFN